MLPKQQENNGDVPCFRSMGMYGKEMWEGREGNPVGCTVEGQILKVNIEEGEERE